MLCGAPVAEHTAPDALTAAALLPPEPGAHNARLAGPTGAGGGTLLIATAGAEQGCTGVTLRLWGPGTDQHTQQVVARPPPTTPRAGPGAATSTPPHAPPQHPLKPLLLQPLPGLRSLVACFGPQRPCATPPTQRHDGGPGGHLLLLTLRGDYAAAPQPTSRVISIEESTTAVPSRLALEAVQGPDGGGWVLRQVAPVLIAAPAPAPGRERYGQVPGQSQQQQQQRRQQQPAWSDAYGGAGGTQMAATQAPSTQAGGGTRAGGGRLQAAAKRQRLHPVPHQDSTAAGGGHLMEASAASTAAPPATATRPAAGTVGAAAAPPARWSVLRLAVPGGWLWPHALPGATCRLLLEAWSPATSTLLPPGEEEDGAAVGSGGGGGRGGDGGRAAEAAWRRLPPLQQLAYRSGCPHAAVCPGLYDALLTPSVGTATPATGATVKAAAVAVNSGSGGASGGSGGAPVGYAEALPWGCFLVGTDTGRLWAHRLDSLHQQGQSQGGAGQGQEQEQETGCGAQGGAAVQQGAGSVLTHRGPDGGVLLLDLQEPLLAVLPLGGQGHMQQQGQQQQRQHVRHGRSASVSGCSGAGPASGLVVVGAHGRVVVLTASAALAAAGEACGAGGEGGERGGRDIIRVLRSCSLLTRAPSTCLRTTEWHLGTPLCSAAVTPSGALAWVTHHGALLAAQLLQLPQPPHSLQSACTLTLHLQPVLLPTPGPLIHISPCPGSAHHLLAVAQDGAVHVLPAHVADTTPCRLAGPAGAAVSKQSDTACGVGGGGSSSYTVGLIAALAGHRGAAAAGSVGEGDGVLIRAGGGGGCGRRRRLALQLQLRQLMQAVVRLGEHERLLETAAAAQWAAFNRAVQVLGCMGCMDRGGGLLTADKCPGH